MSVKAIETKYKGYSFRSRAEARWAVFFDELRLKWEYEPEGFQLESGWYLPDFLVADGYCDDEDLWIEIKGRAPTESEITRLCELCFETNRRGLILWGDPLEYNNIVVNNQGVIEKRRQYMHNIPPFEYSGVGLVWQAAETARSARFEFGRKGAK